MLLSLCTCIAPISDVRVCITCSDFWGGHVVAQDASDAEKIALLNAHPDLAGRAAVCALEGRGIRVLGTLVPFTSRVRDPLRPPFAFCLLRRVAASDRR